MFIVFFHQRELPTIFKLVSPPPFHPHPIIYVDDSGKEILEGQEAMEDEEAFEGDEALELEQGEDGELQEDEEEEDGQQLLRHGWLAEQELMDALENMDEGDMAEMEEADRQMKMKRGGEARHILCYILNC